MKAAFITCNRVGLKINQNGWFQEKHRPNQALLIQGFREYNLRDEDKRVNELSQLHATLQDELPHFSRIFLYVGNKTKLQEIPKLDAASSRVILVTCLCHVDEKLAMIREAGLGDVPRLTGECGGIKPMGTLLSLFLNAAFEETFDGLVKALLREGKLL